MTNSSKDKGTHGETRVLKYLQANGLPGARREVLHGNKDQGDLWLYAGCICEVKWRAAPWTARELRGWVCELRAEMNAAGAQQGLLVCLLSGGHTGAALTIGLYSHAQQGWIGDLDGWLGK